MKLSRLIILLADFMLAACSSLSVENEQTEEQAALPEKFNALKELYVSEEDSLKYKAACYLLEGLPRQWHYDVELFDRTGRKDKVSDWLVIDVDYLAENIEYAFRAWELPWCRDLSFEDFCRWILPYKMADEQPVRWRKEMWEEYSWVLDSASCTSGPRDVCRLVNDSVNEWFTINWDNPYQLDINYFQAKELREGACYGASMMILYPLRALGVPAVFEGVPRWVNRSGAHFWNAVYDKGSLCTFNGPDRNPGAHKVQFVGVGRMLFKMPKVWRRDYLEGRVDVTAEYIPVCSVTLKNVPARYASASLASFDNRNWQSVADAPVRRGKAVFPDMARDVVYLPVSEPSGGYRRVLGPPVLIRADGGYRLLRPGFIRRESVRLYAKYPEDDSNLIFPGERYELFYWDGRWKSLGSKLAEQTYLDYDNVPRNALLWLRNLDKGVQERIFVYDNGKQVWY